MNSKDPDTCCVGFKGKESTNKDFTTYKDFTSEKSLQSVDFHPSFSDIDGSFYSSNNEDQQDEVVNYIKDTDKNTRPREFKTKEEEPNYTSKPALILEKDEIKKSICCNCSLKSTDFRCLLF